MFPLVSAIVLFHNLRSAQEAVACIDALKKQTIADRLEIIVVNNDAETSARTIIAQVISACFDTAQHRSRPITDENNYPSITFLDAPRNLGYGAGNNLGVKKARGEFILIINPDNRLESQALETMIRFANDHPKTGIIGPQLVFPNSTIRDSYRTFPRPSDIFIKRTGLRKIFTSRMRSYLQWDADPHAIRTVDWLCGACLLLRKSLYEELGGFDERFFLFFEDCDLCRRVWERGLSVTYLPEAIAHDHEQRLSAGGLLSFFTKKTVRIHFASAVKYFWKWKNRDLPHKGIS